MRNIEKRLFRTIVMAMLIARNNEKFNAKCVSVNTEHGPNYSFVLNVWFWSLANRAYPTVHWLQYILRHNQLYECAKTIEWVCAEENIYIQCVNGFK